MDDLKKKAIAAVDAAKTELKELSDFIHSHPEIRFEEHQACARLCEFLGARGFAVETPVAGLDTAFTAVYSNGEGPHISFLAEYDALPEHFSSRWERAKLVALILAAIAVLIDNRLMLFPVIASYILFGLVREVYRLIFLGVGKVNWRSHGRRKTDRRKPDGSE